MKYRTLGSTDLKVSVIGLGTWQFGGEWGKDFTESEVSDIISAAREDGINFIDTAECYGDHVSEKLIGSAIKDSRKNWIIATKFGHHFNSFLNRSREFDKKSVESQLNLSLKSLRTDYIDIYQCHSATDDEFENEEVWEFLRNCVQQGKIRYLGISISPQTNTYQTSKAQFYGAKTVQVVYNRLEREAEKEVLPICKKNNLGVLARVPLASGLLSGKYTVKSTFPPNDVRSTHDPEQLKRKLTEVDTIIKTELPSGVSLSEYALIWCLKHEAVSIVIPGIKSANQVHENAQAISSLKNHPLDCEK